MLVTDASFAARMSLKESPTMNTASCILFSKSRPRAMDIFCALEPGESTPYFAHLTVSSWVREPDNTSDYRALYALEQELSDGPPQRFELLSVPRLAHDPGYASWAAEIGTTACQITFFGVGGTQDWFSRRRGAFQDCLAATAALVRAGIRPRWQLFVTRRLLSELDDLLARTDYALRITNNAEEAFLWHGWALYRNGDSASAIADFQKALVENPNYQDAQYALNFVQANP